MMVNFDLVLLNYMTFCIICIYTSLVNAKYGEMMVKMCETNFN